MSYAADKYTQYFIVDSGQTVSGPFHVGRARFVAIHVPPIASASMAINGSVVHGGTFNRLYNGNTEQIFTVASGSRVVSTGNALAGVPHLKIELSTAQTDVRTFAATVYPK